MKTQLIFVYLICLSTFGFAQKSSVDFEIKNLGINVDGHFNIFTINPEFSSEGRLTDLSGKATVSSIKTGIDSRDEHLLEEDYFNAEKHKYITLKSTSITKSSENTYTVKVNLTIKGKTKQITIPISVERTKEKYKVSTYFEINRKDFDVGGSSFVMSKTVKIKVTHYQDNI